MGVLISIHTPVKGVTGGGHVHPVGAGISIHTPVKGVTHRIGSSSGSNTNFNPHTREGCDGTPASPAAGSGRISIHTPVKGVTGRERGGGVGRCLFQSTHP